MLLVRRMKLLEFCIAIVECKRKIPSALTNQGDRQQKEGGLSLGHFSGNLAR